MTRTLLLDLEGWHPHPVPVSVHWIAREGQPQHLIVEAPNSGNAKRWSPRAVLQAYLQLQEELRNEACKVGDPSDAQALSLWTVVPGMPLGGIAPHEEVFSRYAVVPRTPSLAWRMQPQPGTQEVDFVQALPLRDAVRLWGQVPWSHPKVHAELGL